MRWVHDHWIIVAVAVLVGGPFVDIFVWDFGMAGVARNRRLIRRTGKS
jgi:hypothetical protein